MWPSNNYDYEIAAASSWATHWCLLQTTATTIFVVSHWPLVRVVADRSGALWSYGWVNRCTERNTKTASEGGLWEIELDYFDFSELKR